MKHNHTRINETQTTHVSMKHKPHMYPHKSFIENVTLFNMSLGERKRRFHEKEHKVALT